MSYYAFLCKKFGKISGQLWKHTHIQITLYRLCRSYLCIYECVCVWMCVCLWICVRVYACVYVTVCVWYVCVCVYLWMCTCSHLCRYIYGQHVYMCMYLLVCTCICMSNLGAILCIYLLYFGVKVLWLGPIAPGIKSASCYTWPFILNFGIKHSPSCFWNKQSTHWFTVLALASPFKNVLSLLRSIWAW